MPKTPRQSTFAATGARIAYFEWGERGAPAVLLIHATGFHARCWDQTVASLPPDTHVIAVDLRGHGRSEKTGPIADWTVPAQDIKELVAHLNLHDAIGVGHSMGGHTLIQVAAALPGAFKRLVLVDPVMMAPEFYDNPEIMAPGETEHPVTRRRNAWDSWQDMFDAFKDRNPYSLWRPEVLEDYCRYGVVPKADGSGVELACPPAIEGSIYKAAAGRNIYELAKQIVCPVTVLRARQRPPGQRDSRDFSGSPTWEGLAAVFCQGRDVYLPHLTHFIPMQDPGLVAKYIVED